MSRKRHNMGDLENKEVFAKNLMYYLDLWGKEQKEVAEYVGVSRASFNDWVKGRNYPRIDKIEKLANYFGIKKADLIEERKETTAQSKMDTIVSLLSTASPEQLEEIFRFIRFVLRDKK